jgi:IS5 family transposase
MAADLVAVALLGELEHYQDLGARVVDQTKRRVLHGEKVPNDDKLFSIFEPHTELLKRGKAGKPIEFGHMVLFAQTSEKFITDYEACEKKPNEHTLVDGILHRHEKLFDSLPTTFAADKGFYESSAKLAQLEKSIDVVAIGKKGKRTPAENDREHSIAFKLGQAFRSGIEGTISFVKRCLRLHRCFNKGWQHYAATIGATVFAHNLLILARGGG